MAKKRHLVYLDKKQEEQLSEIIERKNLEPLNSVSQVMRFIIEDYHHLLTKKASPDVRLNYISKEVSMILNLVASTCHALKVEHVRNENVIQYWQSQREVERIINENKTRKPWRKKRKPPPEIEAKLKEKVAEEDYYALYDAVHGTQGGKRQVTQREKTPVEFNAPDFLKPFKEKKVNSDDYVEVTNDNWVEVKD